MPPWRSSDEDKNNEKNNAIDKPEVLGVDECKQLCELK